METKYAPVEPPVFGRSFPVTVSHVDEESGVIFLKKESQVSETRDLENNLNESDVIAIKASLQRHPFYCGFPCMFLHNNKLIRGELLSDLRDGFFGIKAVDYGWKAEVQEDEVFAIPHKFLDHPWVTPAILPKVERGQIQARAQSLMKRRWDATFPPNKFSQKPPWEVKLSMGLRDMLEPTEVQAGIADQTFALSPRISPVGTGVGTPESETADLRRAETTFKVPIPLFARSTDTSSSKSMSDFNRSASSEHGAKIDEKMYCLRYKPGPLFFLHSPDKAVEENEWENVNFPCKIECHVREFTKEDLLTVSVATQEALEPALHKRVQKAYRETSTPHLALDSARIGLPCVTRFLNPDTQRFEYYRAEILEVFSRANEMRIRFVDWGNEERIPINRARPLLKQFGGLPPICFPCKLFGIGSDALTSEIRQEIDAEVMALSNEVDGENPLMNVFILSHKAPYPAMIFRKDAKENRAFPTCLYRRLMASMKEDEEPEMGMDDSIWVSEAVLETPGKLHEMGPISADVIYTPEEAKKALASEKPRLRKRPEMHYEEQSTHCPPASEVVVSHLLLDEGKVFVKTGEQVVQTLRIEELLEKACRSRFDSFPSCDLVMEVPCILKDKRNGKFVRGKVMSVFNDEVTVLAVDHGWTAVFSVEEAAASLKILFDPKGLPLTPQVYCIQLVIGGEPVRLDEEQKQRIEQHVSRGDIVTVRFKLGAPLLRDGLQVFSGDLFLDKDQLKNVLEIANIKSEAGKQKKYLPEEAAAASGLLSFESSNAKKVEFCEKSDEILIDFQTPEEPKQWVNVEEKMELGAAAEEMTPNFKRLTQKDTPRFSIGEKSNRKDEQENTQVASKVADFLSKFSSASLPKTPPAKFALMKQNRQLFDAMGTNLSDGDSEDEEKPDFAQTMPATARGFSAAVVVSPVSSVEDSEKKKSSDEDVEQTPFFARTLPSLLMKREQQQTTPFTAESSRPRTRSMSRKRSAADTPFSLSKVTKRSRYRSEGDQQPIKVQEEVPLGIAQQVVLDCASMVHLLSIQPSFGMPRQISVYFQTKEQKEFAQDIGKRLCKEQNQLVNSHLGPYCVVKRDEEYFRAEILPKRDNSNYRVFLVDIGETCEVEKDFMYQILDWCNNLKPNCFQAFVSGSAEVLSETREILSQEFLSELCQDLTDEVSGPKTIWLELDKYGGKETPTIKVLYAEERNIVDHILDRIKAELAEELESEEGEIRDENDSFRFDPEDERMD